MQMLFLPFCTYFYACIRTNELGVFSIFFTLLDALPFHIHSYHYHESFWLVLHYVFQILYESHYSLVRSKTVITKVGSLRIYED